MHPHAQRELATLAKRRGNHDSAATIWLELTADPQHGVFACGQLAIYYEHRAKDLRRAIEFARLGLAKLQRTSAHCRDPYEAARAARLAGKFLNRIKRLEGRKTKNQHTNAYALLLNASPPILS
jgi:lipopolysaccharide biosynthesis regulator YciM